MKNPERREFLRKSIGALSAASALAMLPASIRRALAVEAAVETGSIQDVKHIIILMQENRSFDHYFGTLRGVRGFGDRSAVPLESGKAVWFQSDGTQEIPPYHLDPATSSALLVPDTPHSFPDAQAAWNQGKFGQWPRFKTGYSMGYYRRADIPYQFALAEAFTICDNYHCSLTGSTDPNRIIFWSGSNFDPALGKQGINCTDADAEVVNLRCHVTGAMPTPGYSYSGSPFSWPTLPELLQQAGISWRIYQDPNDNWSGLMHGGLAFEAFRQATAASGSALYQNGMSRFSLDDLRNDVLNGTLPRVVWILPSSSQSEHPTASSPARAANFISEVLDAVTASTDSWSQSVFFLVYDENDGFFDHVPPPAVPSYNADGTFAGSATLSLEGEYFSDPAAAHLLAQDTISGTVRPWGLGARVPMLIVSPWSKGGWVDSQVFDHTSLGMFLEKRFDIQVPNISPWHRAVCGDLTSAFNFVSPNDPTWPILPDASGYAAVEAQQKALPAPVPPVTATALFQESGSRYSRALPYELHTSARVGSTGMLSLLFSNTGQQGVVFHVYDRLHLDRIPRRFTVEAGKTLTDLWNTTAADHGDYNLWVCSTQGYQRSFQGNTLTWNAAQFKPETQVCYEPCTGQIYLKVHNTGPSAGQVSVRANAYSPTAYPAEALQSDGSWLLRVESGATGVLQWDLAQSGQWYDFSVQVDGFERGFAGRLETGQDSVSDPAMAQGLGA